MRHAIATAALAAVAVLLYWSTRSEPAATDGDGASQRDPQHQASSQSERVATGDQPVLDGGIPNDESPSTRIALPRSLRGTQIDGGLTVDARGNFVPDAMALRLFDYLLSTEGEIPQVKIRELLRQIAELQVPADQVDRVTALFDDYLRYRRQAHKLTGRFGSDDIRAQHRELMALQSDIFGDAAEPMFGRANLLAEDTIARREIAADTSLSATERASAAAELDAKLPPDVRRRREKIDQPRRVTAVVEQMRTDGLSEKEIDAYRADEFGQAAADRLRALDDRRAAWGKRLEVYRKERDAVMAGGGSSDAIERELQRLRETHFQGTEVTRVRVLDRMDGNAAQ